MRRTGSLKLLAATIILVLVAAFSVAGTVMSRTELNREELEGYYMEQEQSLISSVRGFLQQKGYKNSGVMLTRVIDEGGFRTYKLTIHHGAIEVLTDMEREALARDIATLYFEDENCKFLHEFLVND